jgi:carboxypeptidase C (cathepsin A)
VPGTALGNRPITFLFNGGPGSSSVWLHMGAFGPKRVITADDRRIPAAPNTLVDNAYGLLDSCDLVFIDATGTGCVAGKEKAFFGVDEDAYGFTAFIKQFPTRYCRWNSPRYLFDESYGTTRSAVLADALSSEVNIDLKGVIMLSQVLNFDLGPDGPIGNSLDARPWRRSRMPIPAYRWITS